MTRSDHHDPNAQDMKPWKRYCFYKFTTSSCYGKDVTEMQSLEIGDMLRIRLREAESDEGIFTSFDEVCADDELQTKKIIKFRLGGRAYSLTLLEFARWDYTKMVIVRWMKRKGAETQKESQICCGQFIFKLGRKYRVLTEDVVRSLSAPVYCRDLDTTTLRDLIDFDGKLIPEDPQSGVPRVGIPRPPRASMQDLYDRMGRMEIRQEAIERMEYR
ncbi:hypothetical protein Tco_1096339 [Tanacetum coccineum]